MFKVLDIVRDRISGHLAVVLTLDQKRRTISLLDCITRTIIYRGSEDLDPWKPNGGGGGNSAMPRELTNEFSYLKALLYNGFTISDTNEIRFYGEDVDRCKSIINSICDKVVQLEHEVECVFA